MSRPKGGKRRGLSKAQSEPAMVRGITLALGLLASAGVGWAADVPAEVIGAVALLLTFLVPLVQGWWTRRAVVPSVASVAQVTTDGRVVAGEAATLATGQTLAVGLAPDGTVSLSDVGVQSSLL